MKPFPKGSNRGENTSFGPMVRANGELAQKGMIKT